MISNQILQETLNGIRAITKCDFLLVTLEGKTAASTDDELRIDKKDAVSFAESQAESQEIRGMVFFKVFDDLQPQFILVVSGTGDVQMIGKMACLQLKSLLIAYKEHFDKESFIKNLLLDNLLLVDVYTRAKKLHISTAAKRVVYIVESGESRDYSTLEVVKGLFPDTKRDFVTAVDENSIIIVKELSDEENEARTHAERITEALSGDGGASGLHVAYGNPVCEIREVSRSYKEARMALDVGKIFSEEQSVIAFSQLGIGRLIYQLPIPLCKMFIREIFVGKSPDEFDEETLTTINKFFENSLNVSETSRQLYIHRNTLVYRLDKLQKSTGLDLRVFDDAITFKIALMVVQYMKYMETLEY